MQHQFHPQLAGLVLHDEEHLVVVGRERFLGVKNRVELEVIAIAHASVKVELGFFFLHDALASRSAGFSGRGLEWTGAHKRSFK